MNREDMFEEIVTPNLGSYFASLLVMLGFKLDRYEFGKKFISAMSDDGEKVHVHLHCSKDLFIKLNELDELIAKAKHSLREGCRFAIIATTSRTPLIHMREIPNKVDLYDINKLKELSVKSTFMVTLYNGLVKELGHGELIVSETFEEHKTRMSLSAVQYGETDYKTCLSKLENVKNWQEYERVMSECIKTLFYRDFTKWQEQIGADNGRHRIDLIGKLNGVNSFWRMIETKFSTQYVVFEFKHYEGLVSENLIFTTQKYLIKAGLKNCTIIIADNGFTESALDSRSRILRNDQKLVIMITTIDVKKMLTLAIANKDPTTVIEDNFDSFIMTMGG